MTTGQWMRILSTIDNGTALQHFKSIKLQPNELFLTIHSDCVSVIEEEKIILKDTDMHIEELYDEDSDIIQIEEDIIQIIDEVIL